MKFTNIFALLLLTIALCFPAKITAVKAYPFPIEVQQPNGELIAIQLHGDEYFHYATTSDNLLVTQNEEGYYLPKANSDEFLKAMKISAKKQKLENLKNKAAKNANITGTVRGLVILVNFKDVRFALSNNKQAFVNLLNQDGYGMNGATGSARNYFLDNSNGKFTPVFDVFGPVTLSQNMEYYGANDANGYDEHPEEMIMDACKLAKNQFSDLNFANYDYDKDGVVDNVFVFYAGYGENDTGKVKTIWPHQSYVGGYNLKIDNVLIDSYACTSELNANGRICGIGVFTHEFGHVLGLPDFYDADYKQNGEGPGIGTWSIMDSGTYLNGGNTPPNYTAMERNMLGWLTPIVLTPNIFGQNYDIKPISSNQAYRINTSIANEYFLMENRKKGDQWDQAIQGEGMLIYHVDQTTVKNKTINWYGDSYTVSADDLWYNKIPNIIGDHQCFDLLRANNNPKVYSTMPFPAGQTSITDLTTPNLVAWDGTLSGVAVTDISRDKGTGVVSLKLTKVQDNSISRNNVGSPLAFSDGNTICFKNITENTQANIYDIKGNHYMSRSVCESDSQEIAVPGIYIVKLQTNNEVFTYKIIIK